MGKLVNLAMEVDWLACRHLPHCLYKKRSINPYTEARKSRSIRRPAGGVPDARPAQHPLTHLLTHTHTKHYVEMVCSIT